MDQCIYICVSTYVQPKKFHCSISADILTVPGVWKIFPGLKPFLIHGEQRPAVSSGFESNIM